MSNWKYENGEVRFWCSVCGHAYKHPCTEAQAKLIEKMPLTAVFPELTAAQYQTFAHAVCPLCDIMDSKTLSDKCQTSIVDTTREILEMCKLPYKVNTVDDCFQLTVDMRENIEDDENYRDAYMLIRRTIFEEYMLAQEESA